MADRVETQTRIINGDIILCGTVTLVIGNIYALYRRQFLELDLSLGDTICAVLGVPEKESHKIRKIISDLSYDVIKKQTKKITAFVEQN